MNQTIHAVLLVGVMSAGTILLRFLPFLLFPSGKKTPAFVTYLGKVLPFAMIGLLVVYCLKDVSVFSGSHGLPELNCYGGCRGVACLAAKHPAFSGVRYHLLYAFSSVCILKKIEPDTGLVPVSGFCQEG